MVFKIKPDPDTAWHIGIEAWSRGDPAYIAQLLGSEDPIPPFARAWLIDALSGQIKRKRGRKSELGISAFAKRYLRETPIKEAFDKFLAVERVLDALGEPTSGTPTDRAKERCADQFGISEDAVSRVIFPRKARNSDK